jgi:hypothetical protein
MNDEFQNRAIVEEMLNRQGILDSDRLWNEHMD